MRSLLALTAAVALVAAAGACGSIIPIPDQGVVVLGCNTPSYCFVANCSCNRADAQPNGSCVVPKVCKSSIDLSTCVCPGSVAGADMGGSHDLGGGGSRDMATVTSQCLEVAQACVGRGPFCGGSGARCLAKGSACNMSGGDPPQLVPTGSMGPALEPHCQFTDDVCCASADGGV